VPRTVLKAGGIADGISEYAIVFGQVRLVVEQAQEPDQGMHAFRLVPVNPGENPYPQGVTAPFRSQE
jgi:hypothetical protein